MGYILKYCNNESFYHIAAKDNVSSVLKSGIHMSEDGNLGEGVYCVKCEDNKSIESVLQLDTFKYDGYALEDLILVRFRYSGKCRRFKPIMIFYDNEIWFVIKQSILPSQIIEVVGYSSYKKELH